MAGEGQTLAQRLAGFTREGHLYERLENGRVRCFACGHRCPIPEGIQFFTALKLLGKEAELVMFPGENHDLSRIGKPKHRVARLGHYIRWFDSHLKQG